MKVQIKKKLTKSRNPKEHRLYLAGMIGECIQVVGDGWCLIEFSMLVNARRINKVKRNKYGDINKRTKDYLQWYVHENDFRFLGS
jgi:hypothetical protein